MHRDLFQVEGDFMEKQFHKRKNTVYKKSDLRTWNQFLKARDSGIQIEIDQEMYEHWRDILPPVRESKNGFYFAEGLADLIQFWKESDQSNRPRYFCQNIYVKNHLF